MAGELKKDWLVTGWVETIGEIGAFDQCTGGVAESAEKKYREGGARDHTVLSAARMVSNVEGERLFRAERDGLILKRLMNARGKAFIWTKQPLDAEGNAFGEPIIYRGKLKDVAGPEQDSNDDEGEAKLKLVQSSASIA